MNVGVSAAWKRVHELWVGSGGAWKATQLGHAGAGGAWKVFFSRIPYNMIALFASAPASPWSAISYSGVYPLGDNAEGGSDLYADTHSHETQVANFANCASMVADDAIIRQNVISVHGASHNYSHSHGATDHKPLGRSWRGAAANGAASIPVGAFLFFNGSSIPSGWARATYSADDFVSLDSSGTGGVVGAAAHIHTHATVTDDIYAERQLGTTYNHPARPAGGHSHSVPNHSEPNVPPYIVLDLISPTGSDALFIPAGVVAFFLGSTVPPGWSVYSAALGRFVRLNSTGLEGTGGSASHGHTMSGASGGYGAADVGGAADGYTCATLSHYHTVTHTHVTGTDNSMPLSRELLICKKD
jgi:hypothetical protein